MKKEGFEDRLGGFLGRSWVVLGAVLGAVLEAPWARVGGILGASKGQHSPKLASPIEGKSIKHLCKNRPKNHRWSEKCRALGLGSRLGAVLEASWARLRAKLAPNWRPKSSENR